MSDQWVYGNCGSLLSGFLNRLERCVRVFGSDLLGGLLDRASKGGLLRRRLNRVLTRVPALRRRIFRRSKVGTKFSSKRLLKSFYLEKASKTDL